MKKIWNWIKNNPNRTMFLIPILLVAAISISHVVAWYDMANPISWAIYLSVAIEIGAITALVAATNKVKGGIWFMFGLVTFIQFVGNIFYSYKEIDPNGDSFKMWVELTGPIWEMIGTDRTDIIGLKRWLAILEGGFLPIISLASLHFFVKYEKEEKEPEKPIDSIPLPPTLDLPNTEEVYVEESEDEPKTDVNYNDDDKYYGDITTEIVDSPIKTEKDIETFVEKVVKEIPTPPNEILENALKNYKKTKPENNNGKTNIRRID
jgi:hypothetical protein